MGSYVKDGGGEAEADREPMCIVFSSWKGMNSLVRQVSIHPKRLSLSSSVMSMSPSQQPL